MHVVILYATVEGQTGKIARFAEETLGAAGHSVTTVDAMNPSARLDIDGADAVILAAPVHERRHPTEFEVLLAARKDDLNRVPTLMLSVSLSAAFPEGMREAKDYLVEMEMRTGFTPTTEVPIAGAVRTRSYDYFAAQLVRHVVLRDRDYDPAQGEHEFTDWPALAGILTDFTTQSSA
ncbi:flavodoxin domain-containing protein [Oceaniglobus indicus]|uniref:flavodoxin domain-containing protein n=1 Tax=Oceaniglobus indicus TaxID=2047749 RepID=UPI000C19C4E8|nr:flavodoxin domain-containing protein [Oceaniglobus indicus]